MQCSAPAKSNASLCLEHLADRKVDSKLTTLLLENILQRRASCHHIFTPDRPEQNASVPSPCRGWISLRGTVDNLAGTTAPKPASPLRSIPEIGQPADRCKKEQRAEREWIQLLRGPGSRGSRPASILRQAQGEGLQGCGGYGTLMHAVHRFAASGPAWHPASGNRREALGDRDFLASYWSPVNQHSLACRHLPLETRSWSTRHDHEQSFFLTFLTSL